MPDDLTKRGPADRKPVSKQRHEPPPFCSAILQLARGTIYWGELHIIESLLLTPLEKQDIAIERCYA